MGSHPLYIGVYSAAFVFFALALFWVLPSPPRFLPGWVPSFVHRLWVQTPPRFLLDWVPSFYVRRNCTLARPVLSFALGPTLPFRFLPEWFPSFVHRRVQRSFFFALALFWVLPSPSLFLPDWVPSYVHRPVHCKLPCALGPNSTPPPGSLPS